MFGTLVPVYQAARCHLDLLAFSKQHRSMGTLETSSWRPPNYVGTGQLRLCLDVI